MPRFVILHHVQAECEHWDFMLEHHGALQTWQLDRPPRRCDAAVVHAVRIDDHRIQYLDYEGAVSRNRGHVKRIESGRYTRSLDSDSRIDLKLDGQELTGRYRLLRTGATNQWQLLPDYAGNPANGLT